MPTFEVELNGQTFEIDAPNAEAAAYAAGEATRKPAAPRSAMPPARPEPEAKPGLWREIAGGMANLNRSIGVGDEMVAGLRTAGGAIADGIARREGPPLPERFNSELARQRGVEDDFAERHPIAAPLIKGTGNAATVLMPGGLGAKAIQGGGALMTAARGATAAGASGAAYGLADRGTLKERVQAADLNAVISAPIGGAAGALTSRLSRNAPATIESGMREAEEALGEIGINIRSLSQSAVERIQSHVRSGRSGREAALAVTATNDLPVPVPMTRGQRTGDPGQQLSENLMLRGAKGSAASRHMRGLVDEQQQALRGNVTAITDEIAGGQPMARGRGGELVSDALNRQFDEADEGVRAAYMAARAGDAGSRLPHSEGPALGQRMREGMADFDLQRVPAVGRELNRIDGLHTAGPVTVRELFESRSRLTNLRSSSDSVEAAAAGRAVRELDASIDDAVTNDLIQGDPASVAAWRDAIGTRRNFGGLFQGNDLIEKLTERTARGGESRALKVDPGDAANYILGRTDLGFIGKRDLYRDMTRLRGALGAQSPAWNGLQAEVFMRIASAGEGAVEHGQRQFSGVKFAKAWSDFARKEPQLIQSLYSPEQRSLIDRFGAVAARVTNPVKGGDNPSNTAVTAARLLGNLRFLKGLPFVKDMTNEIEVQINLGAARRATSPNLSRAPRRGGPGPRVRTAQGIGAGVSATQDARQPGR